MLNQSSSADSVLRPASEIKRRPRCSKTRPIGYSLQHLQSLQKGYSIRYIWDQRCVLLEVEVLQNRTYVLRIPE